MTIVNLSSSVVGSIAAPIILKFSSKQSDLFIDVCPCFQADHWCLCHFFHFLQFGGSESSYGTRRGGSNSEFSGPLMKLRMYPFQWWKVFLNWTYLNFSTSWWQRFIFFYFHPYHTGVSWFPFWPIFSILGLVKNHQLIGSLVPESGQFFTWEVWSPLATSKFHPWPSHVVLSLGSRGRQGLVDTWNSRWIDEEMEEMDEL